MVGDRGLAAVQALMRWDPAGAAERELADRAALGFPPATRMAAVDGPPAAVGEVAARSTSSDWCCSARRGGGGGAAPGAQLRAPPAGKLAHALKAVVAVRSARKAEPVRVQLDPQRLG